MGIALLDGGHGQLWRPKTLTFLKYLACALPGRGGSTNHIAIANPSVRADGRVIAIKPLMLACIAFW